MDENVTIEEYDGPAVRTTGATHMITVTPNEATGVPDLEFMQPGTGFRNGDGPYLEIMAAFRNPRKYTGHHLGIGYEVHHVYLVKEVRV